MCVERCTWNVEQGTSKNERPSSAEIWRMAYSMAKGCHLTTIEKMVSPDTNALE